MNPTPEARARLEVDRLLSAAGWYVCDFKEADIHAARGVAIREFQRSSPSPRSRGEGWGEGQRFDDCIQYIDAKAAGVIEAKRAGATLRGVEIQSAKYTLGFPSSLPRWADPLPFAYESTGIETHFTNGLDPEPRARQVFAFHRPERLRDWLNLLPAHARSNSEVSGLAPATFLAQVRHMPPLVTEWDDFKLWLAQITAIRSLEKSLAANKPRALIQIIPNFRVAIEIRAVPFSTPNAPNCAGTGLAIPAALRRGNRRSASAPA